MIQVLGLVEDEWVFNKLNFIKTWKHNQNDRELGFVCLYVWAIIFQNAKFHHDEFVRMWQFEKC